MACDGGAVFKVIELILCIVCLVYKRYTDNEAIRVFYHLEKLSREWPLLNNITWDENGALLADVTFGGFTLITLGLLIGQLTGELRRARRLNCFFLVLGCIMFLVVGGLCLAAVDQVPHHLVDNAIVLGILAIVTGLLFLVDLVAMGDRRTQDKTPAKGISPPKTIEAKKSTEKERENGRKEEKKDSVKEVDETKTKKILGNGVLKELRSSLKRKKTVEDLDGRGVVVEKNERNVEFESDPDEKIESERVQNSGDDGRQYGRRRMDNRGFPRTASDDSGRFSSDRFRNDFVDAERDRRFDRDFDRADSRNVSVIEGTYDARRSRPPSMREVELDEHYLRPEDYYIEKKDDRKQDYNGEKKDGRRKEYYVDKKESRRQDYYDKNDDRRQDYYITKTQDKNQRKDYYPNKEERRLQDQRISSSSILHELSDDEYQNQLPSVSFLLSERGRKVLPNVSTSPIERVQEVTSTTSPKPRYYYSSSRDPASGSSGPPSPRTPGYVLQTASHWDDNNPEKPMPTTVSDRIQYWFKNRQPSKAP